MGIITYSLKDGKTSIYRGFQVRKRRKEKKKKLQLAIMGFRTADLLYQMQHKQPTKLSRFSVHKFVQCRSNLSTYH